MKPDGAPRLTEFHVTGVDISLDVKGLISESEFMVPVLTARYALKREDGATIGVLEKRLPIPLFFKAEDEKAATFEGKVGSWTPRVAAALRDFLDALEEDAAPELFAVSSTSSSRDTGLKIPDDSPKW